MERRTQNNVFPEDVLIPYFGIGNTITGIEIGVSGGSGSVGMLSRLLNLRLYCVDPWKHYYLSPYEAGLDQSVHDIGYETAKNKIAEFGDRGVIIRATSNEAVDMVPDQVDFVFIDGHHEYYQVKLDIKNYLPKVRKGGLIAGHDYKQVPDVTRAVQELFPLDQIKEADDFIWYVTL